MVPRLSLSPFISLPGQCSACQSWMTSKHKTKTKDAHDWLFLDHVISLASYLKEKYPEVSSHAPWSRIEKKLRKNSYLIIHFRMSSGLNEVSDRVNEWAQKSMRVKQMSEQCERMSKRTSEWPKYLCPNSWLF